MATLAGNTIASTYPLLLKIDSNGIDGTLRAVQDGDATDSALSIATDSVLIKGSGVRLYFHDADGGEHIAGDGTDLTITSGNDIKLAVGSAGSVHSSGVGGTGNTVLGIDAGIGLESGSNYNVFIGDLTGDSSLNDCLYSVGVGYAALSSLTTGDRNTALGYQTLTACTTGEENIAIGRNSMDACISGSYNIGIGTNTLGATADVASTFNIAIGYDAMSTANHADIDECIAIGHSTLNALGANTGAAGSIAIGKEALVALTTGGGNIAIGQNALSVETDANNCTAIGYQALQQQANDSTASVYNTAVGFQAGRLGTTHINSVYVGHLAGGEATITGQSNVIIGSEAGKSWTSANENVAIGFHSQRLHVTGDYNTTLGAKTMQDTNAHSNLQDSSHNTFLGWNSGGGTWSGSSACSYNTGVGSESLENTLDGAGYNVAVGWRAGDAVVDGDKNTCIGAETDVGSGGAENQTAIGYGTQAVDSNNSVTIGNASVDTVCMSQDQDATVHCGGIRFPSTFSNNTNANTLDDYEEGTFTVGWSGASMSSIGNSTAYYTKIGDTVYFQYYNNGMTIGSASSTATITGLPFTTSSASESFATVNLQYANAVDGSSSGGHIGNNSTQLSFTDEGGASYATFIDGSSKKLMVSGT